MNVLIAPTIYLMTGFARGHYTRHKFAVKVRTVSVGKNCVGGLSFQLHTKAGIRYTDLVLWKWKPWLARMKMALAKESKQ